MNVSSLAIRTQPQIWTLPLHKAVLIVGASIFVALSSQIAIPIPFTPVPLTAQVLAVLLTGVILGPRLGGISMLVYLGEGAAGLPVFQSGHSGIWYMFGPTGGYLLGFVTAAFIAGTLYSWLPAPARVRLAVSSFAGLASIYLLGTIWLSFAASITITQAIGLGVAPFITGDAIKIVLVILLAPAGRRLLMGRHPIN